MDSLVFEACSVNCDPWRTLTFLSAGVFDYSRRNNEAHFWVVNFEGKSKEISEIIKLFMNEERRGERERESFYI